MDLTIQPQPSAWRGLIAQQPTGAIDGVDLVEWRRLTREELNLATNRPIVATGHQTLLWHPGILAKYFAAEAFAIAGSFATANLVVDQHVGDFGSFDVPIAAANGMLSVRRLELCTPRDDVPMGRHAAFDPPPAPVDLDGALPSVQAGVRRIFDAVRAHRTAPNAALQMADAIAELLANRVRRAQHVTATDLINTSLAKAMMRAMAADPQRCVACYNNAVAAIPEAGIPPLAIDGETIELPVWRIEADGRRVRGDQRDVAAEIKHSKLDILPRALFMTALVRLGMCDLFIHGVGGANYDRAMELWIKKWLGVVPGSIAVVSATLRLPLMSETEIPLDVDAAIAASRRVWHDPDAANQSVAPSARKREMVSAIEYLPRNSAERKAAFLAMHERLERQRKIHSNEIEHAQQQVQRARTLAAQRAIALRRDWAFPLYPQELIDQLQATIASAFND